MNSNIWEIRINPNSIKGMMKAGIGFFGSRVGYDPISMVRGQTKTFCGDANLTDYLNGVLAKDDLSASTTLAYWHEKFLV